MGEKKAEKREDIVLWTLATATRCLKLLRYDGAAGGVAEDMRVAYLRLVHEITLAKRAGDDPAWSVAAGSAWSVAADPAAAVMAPWSGSSGFDAFICVGA